MTYDSVNAVRQFTEMMGEIHCVNKKEVFIERKCKK